MGRGNVCVHNPYEGLYYIDNDYLHIYRKVGSDPDDPELCSMGELDYEKLTSGDWEYDELESDIEWENTKIYLMARLTERFKSFRPCDEWINREQRAILQSELFYVAVEDNQWSMAVELIQKDAFFYSTEGLQRRHYRSYLNAIRDILFELFPTLGVYGGAWTSGTIRREDYMV